MQKKSFRERVWNILKAADVILEVVDARDVEGTRITDLEEEIKRRKKNLIVVINKIDLHVPNLKNISGVDYVLVSSKYRTGKKELMEKLKKLSKRYGRRITIGIIGYPNTGKSSLINYLIGRRKAKVEPIPGSTKGEQYFRLSDEMLLIDTPGVYTRNETQSSLALKFSYSADRLDDPVGVAVKIINNYLKNDDPGFLFFYGLHTTDLLEKDPVEIMEHIGKKRGMLVKGGKVNLPEVAKMIIRDYQKGNLPPIKS